MVVLIGIVLAYIIFTSEALSGLVVYNEPQITSEKQDTAREELVEIYSEDSEEQTNISEQGNIAENKKTQPSSLLGAINTITGRSSGGSSSSSSSVSSSAITQQPSPIKVASANIIAGSSTILNIEA